MKPILFSTPMVQAILDGRKTMTRRVIKSVSTEAEFESFGYCDSVHDELARFILPDGSDVFAPPKCVTGDILWVRETWTPFCVNKTSCRNAILAHPDYCYKATVDKDCVDKLGCKWRPSIHMPRAAARIFLRVTNVRAERLQEITRQDIQREGISLPCNKCSVIERFGECDIKTTSSCKAKWSDLWDSINAKPKPQYETIDGKKRVTHYVSYPWEDIQETRTWRGKPWYVIGNPWVWVISFERCEKEEI